MSLHPILKNWQNAPILLLEHLQELKKVNTNATILKLIEDLEKRISPDKKKAIMKEVILSRQTKRFLVALLNHQRNSLAHEGLSYSSNLRYYTRLLDDMLEKVQSVLLSVGHKGSITGIISEYNRPFHIR